MTDIVTGCAKTPLSDLLRRIPQEAVYNWTNPEEGRELWRLGSESAPIGRLAHEAADALDAMLAASPHGEGSSADVKPTDGDLWWNPANYEDGFLHWADAFENANEDGVDYSVELHRARKLPPVWGALVWIDGEQKIKIFATEAEADEARVTEGVKP